MLDKHARKGTPLYRGTCCHPTFYHSVLGIRCTMSILEPDEFLYAGLGFGVGALLTAWPRVVSKWKGASRGKYSAEPLLAGPVPVFFGSQSGTAAHFAQRIAEEGTRRGFPMKPVDLEGFKSELKAVRMAIFVVATAGDGEPTRNAEEFAAWLSNKGGRLRGDSLARLEFTVFGLGDSTYEHFNAMGRVTKANLEELGARQFYKYGEGDASEDLEGDFRKWNDGLWKALATKIGGQREVDGAREPRTIPFSVKMISSTEAKQIAPPPESQAGEFTKFYWRGKDVRVVVNRELRSGGHGSTRHIELDLEGTGISYRTADNLAILPENDQATVESICASLKYDPDSIFVFDHDDGYKPMFPTPCSVREALTRFIDITKVPTPDVLGKFLDFVTDPEQRNAMQRLVDAPDEFDQEIKVPCVTLTEALQTKLSSLDIPLEYFLHVAPKLHPRSYTISSSSSVSPSKVHITVSVVEREGVEGKVHRGVCSSFLRGLQPPRREEAAGSGADGGQGPLCRVFVERSSFRLPTNTATPIVMIGPGTGIAPMRAFLQERRWQKAMGAMAGRNVLYFGCRRENEDYIYRDELEAYVADGTLNHLRVAFSRSGSRKVYVQDLLREDTDEVWKLLHGGAYVYVCGSVMMGRDVLNELVRVVQAGMPANEEIARAFLKELGARRRYVQELW